MPILEVEGLVKSYGRRKVVDGVSFSVEYAEIVGLLGPNGAGKTTSFRITCGMIEPDQGRVTLSGIDVTNWPMYRRAKEGGMGYLAQEPSVFRKLSVEQNLLGVMELLGVDRATRTARCDESLEQFGITHIRRSKAGSLSGGERRRLEIARCLLSDPEIILLDEPFTGIDPVTIEDIQKIIRKAEIPRHLDPDHGPPGPRDAGHRRSGVRDLQGRGARTRDEGPGACSSPGPRAVFRQQHRRAFGRPAAAAHRGRFATAD
jgi:lipopolysaccharide export system ATP-binding protein